TDRAGKSKLGVVSPPASWWMQREGAQKFWEWLQPMGSEDKIGAVRGPKLMLLIPQVAATGFGKWWPDMPSSEFDLNRHRSWYASKWVRDTQPSEFLQISNSPSRAAAEAVRNGSEDFANADTISTLRGKKRRIRTQGRVRRILLPPSSRKRFLNTSFGYFFAGQDNTAHPAAGETEPKYLNATVDWIPRGQNGANSEQNDPEMREGKRNDWELDYQKYRDPCATGARNPNSDECLIEGKVKKVLGTEQQGVSTASKDVNDDQVEAKKAGQKKSLLSKVM
ncbi:unnamed protein product, partial [Amoebophrya sp. A25]